MVGKYKEVFAKDHIHFWIPPKWRPPIFNSLSQPSTNILGEGPSQATINVFPLVVRVECYYLYLYMCVWVRVCYLTFCMNGQGKD